MKKFLILAAIAALAGFTSCSKSEAASSSSNEKKPLVLYVVRHGQTIFNLMDKVQGISDGILTEKGIEGAVNMGKGLKNVEFAAVYSSDLGRAYETARYAMEKNIATKNWTVKQMPELREVSFGIYEGDPNYVMYKAMGESMGLKIPDDAKDIMSAAKPVLDYYKGDFMKFTEELANYNKRIDTKYKISEDAAEVYARLDKGIQTILAENPNGGNIMLVAHGQSINFLLKNLKVSTEGQPLGNSSVTKIRYDNGTWVLDGPVGDKSYMEAGAAEK